MALDARIVHGTQLLNSGQVADARVILANTFTYLAKHAIDGQCVETESLTVPKAECLAGMAQCSRRLFMAGTAYLRSP
jgi:hypothetical protein